MPYLQISNACVNAWKLSVPFFEVLLQNSKLLTFVLGHLQVTSLYIFNENLRNGF